MYFPCSRRNVAQAPGTSHRKAQGRDTFRVLNTQDVLVSNPLSVLVQVPTGRWTCHNRAEARREIKSLALHTSSICVGSQAHGFGPAGVVHFTAPPLDLSVTLATRASGPAPLIVRFVTPDTETRRLMLHGFKNVVLKTTSGRWPKVFSGNDEPSEAMMETCGPIIGELWGDLPSGRGEREGAHSSFLSEEVQ